MYIALLAIESKWLGVNNKCANFCNQKNKAKTNGKISQVFLAKTFFMLAFVKHLSHHGKISITLVVFYTFVSLNEECCIMVDMILFAGEKAATRQGSDPMYDVFNIFALS